MTRFKKLVAFVLVCFMIFTAAAGVFAATTKLATYKNLKYGYQFQYENKWKLNGSDVNSYSCYLRPVTYKGTACPQIIVSCQSFYKEVSMEDVVTDLLGRYKTQAKNYKQLSSKAVKTALSPESHELVYTFKQNNKYDVKQRVTIFIKDGIMYQIILAALTKEYAAYEATYNTVLKTIKIDSGSNNTLGLPCIYTVLASDMVQAELSDKTLEDADKISIATSYGSDRDVTYDAEYSIRGLINNVIGGKYDEKKVLDKYSGVSQDIPSNQALIDLSKQYASKNAGLTFYNRGSKVTKVVKNADGVTVGGIVHVVYDITDKKYNRVEGGTIDVYVKFDASGNAGVFGLVK